MVSGSASQAILGVSGGIHSLDGQEEKATQDFGSKVTIHNALNTDYDLGPGDQTCQQRPETTFFIDSEAASFVRRNDTSSSPGAISKQKPDQGKTALRISSENGHLALTKCLLDLGADFNAKDTLGFTALHYSARNGDFAIVTLLIRKGAKLDSVNHEGCTALYLATEEGREDVIRLLISMYENGSGYSEMNQEWM